MTLRSVGRTGDLEGGTAVAERADGEEQRTALHELVARLNRATERRERTRRGTPAFRAADAIQRRCRQILLDDDLFERFLSGDPLLDLDRQPQS